MKIKPETVEAMEEFALKVSIEERLEKLEKEVSSLREFTEGLVDEFRKFNELANQISDVAEMAGSAIKLLTDTDLTE